MRIFKSETNYDFVGSMRLFAVLSGFLVLSGVLAVGVLGLNFGIDFAGGYEIQVKLPETTPEGTIKALLEKQGIHDARLQRFGPEEANEYLVFVREHGTIAEKDKAAIRGDFEQLAGGPDKLTNWAVAESGENIMVGFADVVPVEKVRNLLEEKYKLRVKSVHQGEREDRSEYGVQLFSIADGIREALQGHFAARDVAAAAASSQEGEAAAEDDTGSGSEAAASRTNDMVKRVEFVGPQVGAQLRNQGILAVLYALAFILLYIAVRFDLFFSPGAVVALVHDVTITVGVFAILQIEFNLPIVAAVLALIGYSLNDTIVVYDRIRENAIRLRGRKLRALVNTSINQTLSRTLLTSGTTLLVVLALIIFGGGIIRDFSIALMVGVIVGTYSSVAIASPVYILLREYFESKRVPVGGKSAAA